MKKAYINAPDSKLAASSYLIKIQYKNGDTLEKETTKYSYSDVFDEIEDMHEDENDRSVNSISIEIITLNS